MNNLPNWLKWLIVLVALIASTGLLYYANLRNSQVDMPDPDWVTIWEE